MAEIFLANICSNKALPTNVTISFPTIITIIKIFVSINEYCQLK